MRTVDGIKHTCSETPLKALAAEMFRAGALGKDPGYALPLTARLTAQEVPNAGFAFRLFFFFFFFLAKVKIFFGFFRLVKTATNIGLF